MGEESKAQTEMLEELKRSMESVELLPDEPDFFHSEKTLLRYLKAREWSVEEAEKQLKATVEWRRTTRPLSLECRWCHEKPGFHSMRQVGFDLLGRPVIYSCFAQSAVSKLTPEDAIAHVTYLIENAKVSMPPGVPAWMFVFDCTGMTLPLCNPKLGYSVAQIMASHYPERLGIAVCVNHSPVFQGIWNAIKVFLHPNTSSKMALVRGKKKVRDTFDEIFSEELRDWLLAEIRLNKIEPLPVSQKHFWEQPKNGEDHDPRGCPSYVRDYIDCLSPDGAESQPGASCVKTHKPHPNIADALQNKISQASPICSTSPNSHSKNSLETNSNSSDQDSWDTIEDLEICDEYQIPENAEVLPGMAHTGPTEKIEKKPPKKGKIFSFLAI